VALLEPTRLVARVDAVVLCGGSAFGLAAADGVVRFLAERGQGFPTSAGPVPIVVGAAVFDAPWGSPPGAPEGYAAALAAARGEPAASGRIGAGRGATVGKWRGREYAVPGGLGTASVTEGDATVGALAVVNAAGDVIGSDGEVLAGSAAPAGTLGFQAPFGDTPNPAYFGDTPNPAYFGDTPNPGPAPFEQTTLIVVATDGRLTKNGCHLMAVSAHDGLARALRPAHTRYDGDLAVALATGEVDAHPDRLREAAAEAVVQAVRAAVKR
jgi:L-aminopeptidase/D-esterase-like protein